MIGNICVNKKANILVFSNFLKGAKKEVIPMDKKTLKKMGKDVKFDRTRRITGYLVGNLDRFNDAKRAEEKDRVKHSV